MALLDFTFDANTVEPKTPYEVLPPGDYTVEIINSEMRNTRDNQGKYLWLDMVVCDGQYVNRHIYDRLNLVNNNSRAVEIARSTFSAICFAVNQIVVEDSEQLHLKPLIVSLKVKPAGKDRQGVDRDAQNEVKGYKSLPSRAGAQQATAPVMNTAAQQTAPAAAMAAATRPAASATPPWRRN